MNLIVAMTPSGLIGDRDGLPWHIPADLKHFRDLTMGNTVIMGHNTAKHPAFPLPGRKNVVVSDSRELRFGFEVWKELPEDVGSLDDTFLIGGAKLIEKGIDMCELGYITIVHSEKFRGDVYLSRAVLNKISGATVISSRTVFEEGVHLEFRLVKFWLA